jgi:CHAT domain-containing protein/tetratricopeptide (TPR) repeat protein
MTIICLLLALTCDTGGASQTRNADGDYELTTQTTSVSEIGGGQLQTFKIILRRGQRLRARLTKGDMRIALSASGPGGQPRREYLSAGYEPLDISLVAEADGEHRFEVRSLEAEGVPKPLQFRAEGLSAATPADLADDAAVGLFAEAERLRDSWAEGNTRRAISLYEEASAMWRRLGRRREAARALEGAGECHFTLGDYPQAITAFKKARVESMAARDLRGEGRALNGVGLVLSFVGDGPQVIAHAEWVLARARRLGQSAAPEDRRVEAQALCNKGEAYYNLGKLPDALKFFKSALAIWTEIDDRAGQALARLDTGYALADSGEMLASAESHRQSLALWRAIGHRRGEALTLTAIGGIHSSLDESRLALKFHDQARRLFEELGDRRGRAVVLNNLARAYELLNEFETALEHYTGALNIYRELRSPDAEAGSLLYVGRLKRLMGKTDEALDYCNQSIRMLRQMNKLRMEAYALIEIAAIKHQHGRTQQALDIYQRLLGLYERIGDRRGRAKTLNQMGSIYHDTERTREAVERFEQALALSQKVKDRAEEILIHYNLARAERDLGRIEEALAHAEASVELSESARAQIVGPAPRSSYFAAARKYHELHIELLMKAERERPGEGFAARALRASEAAHARSLLDLLAETSVNIRQDVDSELLEHERSLQQALAGKAQYLTRLLSSNTPPASSKDVEEEVRRLSKDYREVQSRIRDQSPRYATLTQPQPLKLEEIQKELRDDTLLLEYVLGAEKSYLWAITPDSFTAHELPPRAIIEKVADDVYQLLETRPADHADEFNRQYVKVASALSDMLLGKVADQLKGKRLLIVPDGKLHYISFEALPLPGPLGHAPAQFVPLVTQHDVTCLPSASLLAVIRREAGRRQRAAKTVLVLADPVFEADDRRVERPAAAVQDAQAAADAARDMSAGTGARIEKTKLPRIRFTEQEVKAIMSMTPRGQGVLVTDFNASRSTALGELPRQFQVVHFSTHGRVERENPEMSGIVLSMVNRQGQPENGFLQLHDIYNMNLSAELVVISACDSGLGEDIRGEGLVGLTRGFMYAGARSVVASLWQVDDAATAELMAHFYREMLVKGATPSGALRAAKVAMWQQEGRSAPYFWAAFILQGDPDAVVAVGPAEPLVRPRTLVFLLAALVAVVFALRRLGTGLRRP